MPQYNYLNAPEIDQARERTRYLESRNAMLDEAQRRDRRAYSENERRENTEWLAGAAKYGMDLQARNPEAYKTYLPMLIEEGQRRGIWQEWPTPVESLTAETASQGFQNMFNTAMAGLGGPGEEKPKASEAKPPASISEYQLYSEQQQAAGKPPLSFLDFRKEILRQESIGRASGTSEIISSQDRTAAYSKYPRMQAARRDIDNIAQKHKRLEDNILLRGGPFQGGVLGVTEEGQAFQRSVDSLLSHIAALTRIPGVGAQSDWEGRLQQAPLPSLNQHSSVREEAIQALTALVDDLEDAVSKVATGRTENLSPETPGDDFEAKWNAAASGSVLLAPDGTYRRKP